MIFVFRKLILELPFKNNSLKDQRGESLDFRMQSVLSLSAPLPWHLKERKKGTSTSAQCPIDRLID